MGCSFNRVERSDVHYFEVKEDACLNNYIENEEDQFEKIVRISSRTVGVGASYLATGVGFATDFTFSVVGSVIVGVTVCSPVILLEGALQGSGKLSGECVSKVGGSFSEQVGSDLGSKTFKATSGWRCPEVDHISIGLRKVSTCMSKRGSLKQAREQLVSILQFKNLASCISDGELKNINEEISRLDGELF